MKKIIGVIILVITSVLLHAQSINGTFPLLRGQQVKLTGFSGFDTYTIDSISVNDKGNFTLSYGKNDYGVGILTARDNKPFMVILSEENIVLKGESFAIAQSIEISKSEENKLFSRYASEHPRREQTLSAWDYLAKIYEKDSLFSVYRVPMLVIKKEKRRIKVEDKHFLENLAPETYVSWYLPLRKLVSSVSTIAQYRTEEIPATFEAFRTMDYTDPRMYKSGLLASAIESHFWLIENSGRSLDSVYIEMNKSIDHLVANLAIDEQKLNEVTSHLFKFLEKRSLFTSSEYLALKLLNQKSCTLTGDFASQLESYRAMKKGNTVPNIIFTDDIIAPNYTKEDIPQSLWDVECEYKVVVFGASWCPQCPQELQSIAQNYANWQQYGVEVVFVSLDESKETFTNFTKPFPFISTCDYLRWESPVAKDWYVFATPTIYLLNSNQEIVLRPNSVDQLNAWVDWYLVKGNM